MYPGWKAGMPDKKRGLDLLILSAEQQLACFFFVFRISFALGATERLDPLDSRYTINNYSWPDRTVAPTPAASLGLTSAA